MKHRRERKNRKREGEYPWESLKHVLRVQHESLVLQRTCLVSKGDELKEKKRKRKRKKKKEKKVKERLSLTKEEEKEEEKRKKDTN